MSERSMQWSRPPHTEVARRSVTGSRAVRGQRRRGGAGLPAAVAFAVAALVAAPLGAQETRPLGTPVAGPDACGAGLVGAPGAEWLTESPVEADFTLDGQDDAVVWGVADGQLILLVARCVGGETADTWRFGFPLEGSCDARSAIVRPGSLLIERAAVERVCAKGEGRDECIHLRRENARRQALVDAGGREIRVDVPACMAMSLVWDETLDGFIQTPR